MESLYSVFESIQRSTLNLAPVIGIRAGSLAPARIARSRRSAVNDSTPRGVREDREEVLVLWTSPDIAIRVIHKTSSAHSKRPLMSVSSGPLQPNPDQSKADRISQHQDELKRYASHDLAHL
jgi:hypothetical protein